MNIQYWHINHSSSSDRPMTIDRMAGHLAEDWLPALSPGPSHAFVGLLSSIIYDSGNYWTVNRALGGTDSQWKQAISWLLGVVGARETLAAEGYRWIAPVSAFAPTGQRVPLVNWHPSFPQSRLVAAKPPQPSSKLLPDYLAIHPAPAGFAAWAAAEAKGTRKTIASRRDCLPEWKNQAENVEVRFNGHVETIPRHIVTATRVNPNATRDRTRRMLVRSWNRALPESPKLDPELVVEIAAAHLFGVCSNLGLWSNAEALANGVRDRRARAAEGKRAAESDAPKQTPTPRADRELGIYDDEDGSEDVKRVTIYGSEALPAIDVVIEVPTVRLIRELRSPDPQKAVDALARADAALDALHAAEVDSEHSGALLPSGVRVNYWMPPRPENSPQS
ncbi:hypothetical protein [Longimicrobium terrae]|uniref:Uncharacterized protein n=1 Tax=Longimicrobium terrae TaxID=1639882 RepID=A0A841H1I7_9BACT|nr:hypothetical protein [Longimicrobium terrae]MBB4637479.1 hypothetical protein [Longimicrobium terrae]MBB6071877.1 hypothetical protein [Longimicrobium terrae]NNC30425.1 hypothetical protein [Longimicrobium terrae]